MGYRLAVIFLTCAFPALATADYARGLAAYKSGDYATAHQEWLAAAELGEARAQYRLADLYETGLGVARDFHEASKWYRQAAHQGHPVAQHMIGLTYAYGLGVPRDAVAAHMWLTLAAASGDPNAQAMRDTVAASMSPEQLADARKMALEWRKENSIKQ